MRRWTEPAKTNQQRSRCVGQQAWKRKGLTLITPARDKYLSDSDGRRKQ
jgi:hypothetical protein